MEGSDSEAIFDSLKLNPQLFINAVLNSVDELVDDAFDFFHKEASTMLKIEGTDKSEDLSKGVAYLQNMVRSVLDKRLSIWEKYCLRHCFAVPEGFSLPRAIVVKMNIIDWFHWPGGCVLFSGYSIEYPFEHPFCPQPSPNPWWKKEKNAQQK